MQEGNGARGESDAERKEEVKRVKQKHKRGSFSYHLLKFLLNALKCEVCSCRHVYFLHRKGKKKRLYKKEK